MGKPAITRALARSWLARCSPTFSKVARYQAAHLAPERMIGRPVPITCRMREIDGHFPAWTGGEKPWESLDRWLRAGRSLPRQRDGTGLPADRRPGGCRKTTVVREAALSRAETFDGSAPLILQVVSRGRVLQNIADLIAFPRFRMSGRVLLSAS